MSTHDEGQHEWIGMNLIKYSMVNGLPAETLLIIWLLLINGATN
jgi:hypothetical protein